MSTVSIPNLHALFVAWQQQDSRRYFPIGRLVVEANNGRSRYEFAYVKGALEAAKHGLDPLLAFPDFQQVYRSDELFPLFENRLMPSRRPDYEQYLANLGLTPDADPIAVLARSGGRRVTDSLELFELPLYDSGLACYRTFFLAHGIRYLHQTSLERIHSLTVGDALRILVDFQNPADARALALGTDDRVIVGYMPRYLLDDAWNLIQNCPRLEVFVAQVNPTPAPIEQRLLCRIESCWPDDFRPFCSDHYLPISPEATTINCDPAVTTDATPP
jgi:hypothetical protein